MFRLEQEQARKQSTCLQRLTSVNNEPENTGTCLLLEEGAPQFIECVRQRKEPFGV
jgi:hypothetical protein